MKNLEVKTLIVISLGIAIFSFIVAFKLVKQQVSYTNSEFKIIDVLEEFNK